MKHIHNWMNNIAGRLALVALLLMGAVSTQAANKITIEDFSIAPGETKTVSVSMVNDATDILSIAFTIDLPEGLEYVTEANPLNPNKPKIKIALNGERLSGWSAYGSSVTNSVSLTAGLSLKPVSGTSGVICTFQVKASEDLAEESTIGLSELELTDANDEPVRATAEDATVTKGKGGDEPGPGPDDPTVPSVTMSFAKTAVVAAPGVPVLVDVILSNNLTLTLFQGKIEAPEGWDISVVDGVIENSATNPAVLFSNTPVTSKVEAVAFQLSITAPADFSGTETLSLTGLKFMADMLKIQPEDISLILLAGGLDIRFSQNTLSSAPGRDIAMPVLMDNDFAFNLFQANLDAPQGWNATVADGRLVNVGTLPRIMNDNANNIIEIGEGTLFTVNATVPDDFLGVTTFGLNTIKVMDGYDKFNSEDLNVVVDVKDEDGKAAADAALDALQDKLDAALETIEEDYPDAAKDDNIQRLAQVIQQGIVFQRADVQEDYDNYEFVSLDPQDVRDLDDAIDDLLEGAASIVNEDNEAGKAALDKELDDLRKMLADAMAKMPEDLPESAEDAFEETAGDITDDIDDLEAAVDAAYAAEELTADIDLDEFAPEEKQAIIDAIKALEAEILTWLRGDVAQNQKVEMPDFYALADSILNENLPTDKEGNAFYRFDANADDEINVGDMQGIVNIVLGMDAYGNASRQAEAVEARLSVESAKIGNITRYTLSLTGMEYTAFQMDVNGRVAAETADGMTLRTADLKSGARRVLGFGAAKSDGTVLYIDVEGQAQFSNIVFTTGDARTVKFNLGNATGISTVKSAAASGQAYDLGGRAVKNAKGVVIIDGKKVIR